MHKLKQFFSIYFLVYIDFSTHSLKLMIDGFFNLKFFAMLSRLRYYRFRKSQNHISLMFLQTHF